MASFSAGQAVGSGFRLIGREPVAVLYWAAAYAVFAAVTYGLMWNAFPEMLGYYQAMGRAAVEGAEPDPSQALAMASKMWAVMPFIFLLSLVFYPLMLGAIYRAVLHPEDRRFGYLRFGRNELWLLATMAAWSLLMMAIYIALLIAVSIVGAVVVGVAVGASGASGASSAGAAAAVAVTMLLMLICWLVMLWLMLRLSLAFPMSHDKGRFVLFESWRVTRGQSLKMLGVGVLLVVIVIGLEVVVMSLFAAVAAAAAGPGGFATLLDTPTDVLAARMAPWMLVFVAFSAVLGALVYTILAAPIADIWRQLKPAEADVF